MNNFEKMIDEYLEKKENEAWEKYGKQLTTDKLPREYNDMIKNTFLIAYGIGSNDGNDEIFNYAINDPVGFYNEVKHRSVKGD